MQVKTVAGIIDLKGGKEVEVSEKTGDFSRVAEGEMVQIFKSDDLVDVEFLLPEKYKGHKAKMHTVDAQIAEAMKKVKIVKK